MLIDRNAVAIFCISCSVLAVVTAQAQGKGKDNRSRDSTVKTVKSKPCRFKWEWEALIYGSICLPAKSSMMTRKKSTAINRHKHRHKNKNYKDRPVTVNRHINLYRKGEGKEDVSRSGLLMERGRHYQMDAPRYVSSHSVSVDLPSYY